MQLNQEGPLYGVVQGVYYGQNERVDELNDRIANRYFSDTPIPPNFDPRSVPTKYAHFPCIDRRPPSATVPHLDYYSPKASFVPPINNRNGPPAFYMANVDTETILRNQPFALQRGAGQNVYIPSSNSDLYKVTVNPGSNAPIQSNPLLFEKPVFSNALHPNLANAPSIGRDIFFNNTRTQLRSI